MCQEFSSKISQSIKSLTKNKRLQKLVENIQTKIQVSEDSLNDSFDNVIRMVDNFQEPQNPNYDGQIEYADF